MEQYLQEKGKKKKEKGLKLLFPLTGLVKWFFSGDGNCSGSFDLGDTGATLPLAREGKAVSGLDMIWMIQFNPSLSHSPKAVTGEGSGQDFGQEFQGLIYPQHRGLCLHRDGHWVGWGIIREKIWQGQGRGKVSLVYSCVVF